MRKLALLGGTPVRTAPFPLWPRYDENEKHALMEVLESRKWGTIGPKVQEFEKKFAAFIGVRYAQSVSNGTVSLEAILRAMAV
ncbi:MAG: DegT/DnrJ/EryC1/StrS family aminotransferase, partial [Spirochaetota bacterium]